MNDGVRSLDRVARMRSTFDAPSGRSLDRATAHGGTRERSRRRSRRRRERHRHGVRSRDRLDRGGMEWTLACVCVCVVGIKLYTRDENGLCVYCVDVRVRALGTT